MTTEQIALAKTEYAYGQDAFDRGRYQQATTHFEKALSLAKATTSLGGEIQIWLVNAYYAADRQQDAIALCEKVSRHPDYDVRKQAQNLLYILKAPRLQKRADWNSKIPDLAALAEDGSASGVSQYAVQPKKAPKQKKPPEASEPIDWSQINTQDNAFLWLALVLVAVVLGSLVWLS